MKRIFCKLRQKVYVTLGRFFCYNGTASSYYNGHRFVISYRQHKYTENS